MVAAVDGPGRVRCAGGRLGIGAVVQHANQNELCKYNPPHGFRALCKVPASLNLHVRGELLQSRFPPSGTRFGGGRRARAPSLSGDQDARTSSLAVLQEF